MILIFPHLALSNLESSGRHPTQLLATSDFTDCWEVDWMLSRETNVVKIYKGHQFIRIINIS